VAKRNPSDEPRIKQFHSKVVGVTFANDDGSSRQKNIRKFCKSGLPLTLIHEADNPVSDCALGVWVRGGWTDDLHQIGHIRSGLAEDLLDDMEAGNKVEVTISEVTGGYSKHLGVNILIKIVKHFDVPLRERSEPRAPNRREQAPKIAKQSPNGAGCGCLWLVVIGLAIYWFSATFPPRPPKPPEGPALPTAKAPGGR
jgi:hypothetical protein